MFEHFGIKDIFCGLWKFKYWILLSTAVLGIIGGFVFSSDIVKEGHEEYYYSQTGTLIRKKYSRKKKNRKKIMYRRLMD